jgi:uncharacterized protein
VVSRRQLATRFAFRRNRTGDTRRSNVLGWAGLAYVLPLAYATAAYGAVWATGEELGWRGFLVPALARTTSFGRTALLSGAIWAAWHVPLIVLADNRGTPAWYAVPCFAVGVVSLSVAFAWLRLRSGRFWPAAILHSTHNLFVQGFFDPVTVDTGPTRWLTGEFGAALAAALVVTGWLFWRRRESVLAACAET